MHLFINALAASAGGGLTYIRNVIPHFAERTDVRVTILLSDLGRELTSSKNVYIYTYPNNKNPALRFWVEQYTISKLIKQAGADVLLSTGNFAIWNSCAPQILLSRNSLYTSPEFRNDLRRRGDYRLWLDTELKATFAHASIVRAEYTVAPSVAFAEQLRAWTGVPIRVIYHGFDGMTFTRNHRPLPSVLERKLREGEGALRVLFVSHYNYYRNFCTLIKALPLLKRILAPRRLKLVLTCTFQAADNPGYYEASSDASLAHSLGVEEDIVQLGAVPYDVLHHLYAACDIYVTPAYAESFAHPLLEAMFSGLPVVASDLPVHREICRDAAVYFAPNCPQELAERVGEVAASSEMRCMMKEKGRQRAATFSWRNHVQELIAFAETLV